VRGQTKELDCESHPACAKRNFLARGKMMENDGCLIGFKQDFNI
jgi:hypothetical protein